MSFWDTPAKLKQAIDEGVGHRETAMKQRAEVLRLYAGGSAGELEGEESLENTVFQFVALMLPRLVFAEPRLRVKTRRGEMGKAVAAAMQHGLNRWIRDSDAVGVLRRLAYDYLIGYAVALVRQGVMPGHDPADPDALHWPVVTAIMPERFVLDPTATCAEEVRWSAHLWRRTRESLAAEPEGAGWDQAAVAGAGTSLPSGDPMSARVAAGTDTDHVYGWEVWVRDDAEPGRGAREGFHGSIHTIAADGGQLRRKTPYWGPRTGPHRVMGAYHVPNQPYPMSPLAATLAQMRATHRAARAVADGFDTYKRMALVNSKNPDLEKTIASGEHANVYGVPDFSRDQVQEMELGGATKQQIEMLMMLREREDRAVGLTDAMRGSVTGKATATENAIADSSMTARVSYITDTFRAAVASVLRDVGWFLYHDDAVVIPVGDRAGQAMGMFDPMFLGGQHEWESGLRFDDLELDIEPYSMQRVDQGLLQSNLMQLLSIVTQVAPLMPQMPYVNWKSLLEKAGDALNDDDMGALVDPAMAQTLAFGQPIPPPQAPPPGPRFGKTFAAPKPAMPGELSGRETIGAQR